MTDLPILQPFEGEKELWHGRRLAFVFMGKGRSIEKVYQYTAKQSKTQHGKRPHPQWYEIAERFQWRASARAWDEEAERELERDAKAIAQKANQEFLALLPAIQLQVLNGFTVYNRAMETLLDPKHPLDVSKIKITDVNPLVAALEKVRAMQREAHGEPTARFDLTSKGEKLPPGVIIVSQQAEELLDLMGWPKSELSTLFEDMIRELANARR